MFYSLYLKVIILKYMNLYWTILIKITFQTSEIIEDQDYLLFSKLTVTNTWHKFCDFPQPCYWHSFLLFQFFLQNPLNIAVQKATAHKLVLMPKFIYINPSWTKPWVRSDAHQGFLIFCLKLYHLVYILCTNNDFPAKISLKCFYP